MSMSLDGGNRQPGRVDCEERDVGPVEGLTPKHDQRGEREASIAVDHSACHPHERHTKRLNDNIKAVAHAPWSPNACDAPNSSIHRLSDAQAQRPNRAEKPSLHTPVIRSASDSSRHVRPPAIQVNSHGHSDKPSTYTPSPSDGRSVSIKLQDKAPAVQCRRRDLQGGQSGLLVRSAEVSGDGGTCQKTQTQARDRSREHACCERTQQACGHASSHDCGQAGAGLEVCACAYGPACGESSGTCTPQERGVNESQAQSSQSGGQTFQGGISGVCENIGVNVRGQSHSPVRGSMNGQRSKELVKSPMLRGGCVCMYVCNGHISMHLYVYVV